MWSRGYVWHIYLDDQHRWMIKLEGTVRHGPHLRALNGYYYHMSDFNYRFILRLVKPHDDLEVVELHADWDAVLGMFYRSNGQDMLQFMPQVPNVPLAEPICDEPFYLSGVTSDIQPHFPVASPVIIPDLPPLDSSYHTGLETQITRVESIETALTPWSSTSSAGEACTNPSVVMAVPDLNKTKEDVMSFVTDFLRGLNKGVRRVACSRCRGEKRNKLWDIKPSNLTRHLFSHFQIKGFPCDKCNRRFTTKHQLTLHLTKQHPDIV
ncbi:hypothetical protein RSOLAG22IIIB_02968 [Rhizoctonia solani]|uniref:C2H2-type domain-containing protein n=1 Tax=Rhizoctonia solani TaxID=456999 RepID=A0A0K6FLB1_9AGAM|nr:hypothetical protein RSOLAG22IIIB_02968 [Rhizoctonia solani]